MQPDNQTPEFNAGFKQLARGNLNLLLRTEIKCGQNKRTQIKEHIGKTADSSLCH